jgi:hypothetical protein
LRLTENLFKILDERGTDSNLDMKQVTTASEDNSLQSNHEEDPHGKNLIINYLPVAVDENALMVRYYICMIQS